MKFLSILADTMLRVKHRDFSLDVSNQLSYATKAQEEQLATSTKAPTKGTNNLHQFSPRLVSDSPSVIAW